MAGDDYVPPPVPSPPEGIPGELPDEALPEMSGLQDDFESRLDGLISRWPDLSAPLITSLVDQVAAAEDAGNLVGLQDLSVTTFDQAAQIEEVLVAAATWAAEYAAAEAADQDVEIGVGRPDRNLLAASAQVSAATLGAGLVMSATREALRWWGRRSAPSGAGSLVADAVGTHLASLTTAQSEYVLGGAITGAQREGRASTARAGPSQALYGSEVLDTATCKNCRVIHGKWLGNSDDMGEPWLRTYPVRGYVHCLGRDRCRGQIVYVWRGGTDWKKWIEKEPWR